MNKKALSLGMIVPLAAAGAVATAPAASAASVDTGYRHSRADLDLSARAVRGNWIKVVATLDANERRNTPGKWVVVIKKNGKVIETESTRGGFLRVVEFTYDKRGTDKFTAIAFNTRTHQVLVERDVVKKWERGSR